jgi:hypothetical protein
MLLLLLLRFCWLFFVGFIYLFEFLVDQYLQRNFVEPVVGWCALSVIRQTVSVRERCPSVIFSFGCDQSG